MLNLLSLFLKSLLNFRLLRFNFLPLKNVDLIIYGHSHINFIFIKYLKSKKYKIIEREKIELNIFVLVKYLFSKDPDYTYLDYLIFKINLINPQITISSFDNDPNYWKIADKLKCKTILIQNGWRTIQNDIFENLKKPKKKFHIDYICLWSEIYNSLYGKFLTGKFIITGSIKNNFFKKNKTKKKREITFISQFRKVEQVMKSEYFQSNPIGFIINQPEERLLPLLNNFCKKNKINLNILSTSLHSASKKGHTYVDEYEWYNRFLIDCNWKLIKNSGSVNLPYKIIDESKLIVSMDSSLGYESLARDCKTVYLPKRNKHSDQIFGWPYKLNSVGNFWISRFLINNKQFEIFLQKNLILNNNKWLKKNKNIKEKLCFYDINNRLLKKIFLENLNI